MATLRDVNAEISAMRQIGMKVSQKVELKAHELVADPDNQHMTATELVDLAIDLCL